MVKYLLIVVLCLIATTKSIILSKMGKEDVKNAADGVLVNGLVFMFAAMIFLKYLAGASTVTMVSGIVLGTLSVIYQLAYIIALSSGPLSMTGLVNNLSMIVPIAVSAILFKEPLSGFRVAGILLSIATLVINTQIKEGDKISKKWCIFIILSFIANGLLASTTKIYSHEFGSDENFSFVAYSYLTAAILSAIVYFVLKLFKTSRSFKYRPSIFVCTALAGVLLGCFQALYTYSSSIIDGTLMFPAYNGGFTLFLTLSGIVVYREKLNRRQWIGVVTGMTAIILMCL